MQRNFRVARACAVEAARDFRWREYAPFGWILGVQLLFVLLALNLGTTIGMGTAGAAVRLFTGDPPIHYPTFFLILPNVTSWLEVFLYTIPGAVLIPLAIARIRAPMDPELQGPGLKPRLRRAVPPTLIAGLVNLGLLFGWQWLFNQALVPLLRASFPGFQGNVTIWGISLLGAYALSAVLLYVPIVAIGPGATLVPALKNGVAEGVKLFKWTLLFVLVFSLPAMPFLLVMQLMVGFISERMRPEMVAVIIAIYSILISLGTYLAYAAAARLHWASQMEEA
jgi:hypothetical protein